MSPLAADEAEPAAVAAPGFRGWLRSNIGASGRGAQNHSVALGFIAPLLWQFWKGKSYPTAEQLIAIAERFGAEDRWVEQWQWEFDQLRAERYRKIGASLSDRYWAVIDRESLPPLGRWLLCEACPRAGITPAQFGTHTGLSAHNLLRRDWKPTRATRAKIVEYFAPHFRADRIVIDDDTILGLVSPGAAAARSERMTRRNARRADAIEHWTKDKLRAELLKLWHQQFDGVPSAAVRWDAVAVADIRRRVDDARLPGRTIGKRGYQLYMKAVMDGRSEAIAEGRAKSEYVRRHHAFSAAGLAMLQLRFALRSLTRENVIVFQCQKCGQLSSHRAISWAVKHQHVTIGLLCRLCTAEYCRNADYHSWIKTVARDPAAEPPRIPRRAGRGVRPPATIRDQVALAVRHRLGEPAPTPSQQLTIFRIKALLSESRNPWCSRLSGLLRLARSGDFM